MISDVLNAPSRWAALDRVAGWVDPVAQSLNHGPLGGLLRGRSLGHPLHPAVVTLPLGLSISAAVTSTMPAQGAATFGLLAGSVASTPAAVLTGLTEFTTLGLAGRRVAVAHLTVNLIGTSLLATALLRADRRALWAGVMVSGVAAALGGNLGYRHRARLIEAGPA
jgi:hypothetical protein